MSSISHWKQNVELFMKLLFIQRWKIVDRRLQSPIYRTQNENIELEWMVFTPILQYIEIAVRH